MNVPIGQGPQGVAYVPGAVTGGDGRVNLMPLAKALAKTQLELSGTGRSQVTLFDEGQVQILQAAVAGLPPKTISSSPLPSDRKGGASVHDRPGGQRDRYAVGPISPVVTDEAKGDRRYLVVATGTPDAPGAPVQVQR